MLVREDEDEEACTLIISTEDWIKNEERERARPLQSRNKACEVSDSPLAPKHTLSRCTIIFSHRVESAQERPTYSPSMFVSTRLFGNC